jgi:hypothetical protein
LYTEREVSSNTDKHFIMAEIAAKESRKMDFAQAV